MTVGYYENERKGSVFTANCRRKILKTCARKACCVVKEMLFFQIALALSM